MRAVRAGSLAGSVAAAALVLGGVAACGSSSGGVAAATWADSICGPFATYGQDQITATGKLNDASGAASTDQAATKVQAAGAALEKVVSDIGDLRHTLSSVGTPAVADGAGVIASLDKALATQATQTGQVAGQVRALEGAGQPLVTQIQALTDKFSTGNLAVSNAVSSGFENTKGGQALEKALAASKTCAAKLQAAGASSAAGASAGASASTVPDNPSALASALGN